VGGGRRVSALLVVNAGGAQPQPARRMSCRTAALLPPRRTIAAPSPRRDSEPP